MIICRKVKACEEIENLKEILRYYSIKDNKRENSIIYVIEENDRIIGGSKILLYNDIGILEYLVVDNNRTGEDLGDGLLRSILNYCNLNGIKMIYYHGEDLYLMKKGFIYNFQSKNEDDLDQHIQNSSKLVCIIEDFFRQGCKGRRD